MSAARLSILCVVLVTLGACQRSHAPSASTAKPAAAAASAHVLVDAATLDAADQHPGDWMSYGRTYSEQRFSPLKQVNASNVGQLGLAWHYDLATAHRAQESTPIVVNGVMYVTSSWSKVFALDARTGKEIWRYDPKVPGDWGINACCGVDNRGVAVWKGKVYLGTLDGRLIALDARTGKVVWSVQTTPRNERYSITGAPRVVKGRVIIGNAGGEMDVRGYISAYDAASGKLDWRFYTVPGKPGHKDGQPSDAPLQKIALPTWHGKWWKHGGGGTVWDAIAYDPELDLLYFGTDNGAPWNSAIRSPGGGDNLFITSIIAVRPESGKFVWYFQNTPGGSWDFSATQPIILADLKIDGKLRHVLMQAPKNGFFYILDRATGKFISGTPFAKINWAKGLDPKTGRPIIDKAAFYGVTGKPWVSMPGPMGAHSWPPMSYSPLTGLVYIPVADMAFPFIPDKNYKPKPLTFDVGIDFAAGSLKQTPQAKAEANAAIKGRLIAWDPVAGRVVWHVDYGHKPWGGGTLATAGNLVFEGTAMGQLVAYQADNGKKLWSGATQAGVLAAPISYAVDGQQYVAVEVGWGGAFGLAAGELAVDKHTPYNYPRVLAFKLNGKDSLPPLTPRPVPNLPLPPDTASAATIAQGKRIYHPFCTNCHGDAAVSGGVLPDLRYSVALGNPTLWQAIVHDGILRNNGMVSFAQILSKKDIEKVRDYVIHRAHQQIAEAHAAGKKPQQPYTVDVNRRSD